MKRSQMEYGIKKLKIFGKKRKNEFDSDIIKHT